MAKYWVKSTDGGVPTVTGQNGSLTTLITYLAGVASLTIPYTGTNKLVLQTSTGSVIRAVHDSSVSGAAQLCVVRAAESASGIDTIADPFPTVALFADTSCNVMPSTTANSTARAWWALIDTTYHCFYLFFDSAGTGSISSGIFWFAPPSIFAGDSYKEFMHVRGSTSSTSQNFPPCESFNSLSNPPTRLWAMRTRDGIIKSPLCFLGPNLNTGSNATPGVWLGPPAPSVDGDMRMCKVWAGDMGSTSGTAGTNPEPQRVWVPNLWMPMHIPGGYSTYTCGEEFTNSSYNPSSLFAFFPFGNSSGSRGAIVLEISDTWTGGPTP